jgi:hypothetical protein
MQMSSSRSSVTQWLLLRSDWLTPLEDGQFPKTMADIKSLLALFIAAVLCNAFVPWKVQLRCQTCGR